MSDSGRAYNLFNELGGAALGQRITEVNVEQALGFKALLFGCDIHDASDHIGSQSPASQAGFEPS